MYINYENFNPKYIIKFQNLFSDKKIYKSIQIIEIHL